MCYKFDTVGRTYLLVSIILIVTLPLGIASVTISKTIGDQCDYQNIFGLDIQMYLLISGIFDLVLSTIIIVSLMVFKFKPISIKIILALSVIDSLFEFLWIVFGAIILFIYNLQCVNEASVTATYAVALFCIKIVYFVAIGINISTFPNTNVQQNSNPIIITDFDAEAIA